jgi:hypothetical protein
MPGEANAKKAQGKKRGRPDKRKTKTNIYTRKIKV